MEVLPKLRHPCRICRAPVSPCPSPAVPDDISQDFAPVVCTSVLLSVYYPQFIRNELESKIKVGKISRGIGAFNGNLLAVKSEKIECEEETEFPELVKRTASKRHNTLKKTSPDFFLDIAQLQKNIFSGHTRRRLPLPQSGANKSISSSSKDDYQLVKQNPPTKPSKKPRDLLLPPILDVWAQNDAMQRSLRLRI
ncbi:uncharacterized protein O3C94_004128 [Discoglossus pictus]